MTKQTKGLKAVDTIPPKTAPRIPIMLSVAEENELASAKSFLATTEGMAAWREGLKKALRHPIKKEPAYKIQTCLKRKENIKEDTIRPRAKSERIMIFFLEK